MREPQNAQPSPMDYEIRHVENPTLERQKAARDASSMTVAELEETAERIGVDLSDADNKAEKVEKVRSAGRGAR